MDEAPPSSSPRPPVDLIQPGGEVRPVRRGFVARLRGVLRQGGVYLATGLVLFFASERLFWSTFRPGDRVGDLLVTWLAYSVLGCVFLNLVVRLRCVTVPSVFLAGAAYGWLTEGTLVGTLYGTEASAPFPMSLVWTGLSWHAPVSVLGVWHLLSRALVHPQPWRAVRWSVALGLYWGAWAPFLWRETPPEVSPVGVFAAHGFAATLGLAVGQAIWLRTPPASFRPGWFGLALSLMILGVFYAEQVRTLGARPLIVLPLLLAGVLGVLGWTRASRADLEPEWGSPSLRPGRLMILFLAPAVATLLYAGQRAVSLPGIAPIHFYRAGAVLGVLLLVGSIYRILRVRPAR